ncbi:hypothetical protein LSAT2_018797 [Lamellibrachia satsuma]|nr:hypothetical protein LSAT2_018797 [Lamellibrachia satsuma]
MRRAPIQTIVVGRYPMASPCGVWIIKANSIIVLTDRRRHKPNGIITELLDRWHLNNYSSVITDIRECVVDYNAFSHAVQLQPSQRGLNVTVID